MCSNGHGPLIKITTMPIYCKKILQASPPQQSKLQGCILVHVIMDSWPTKFVQIMAQGLPLTFFYGKVKFASPCIFIGQKVIFSKCIKD